jgi:hypothetical protein
MSATPAGQEAPDRRTVVVRLSATSRTGATGSTVAWDHESLAVGETMESSLRAGMLTGRGFGVGGGKGIADWYSFPNHAWQVQVQLVAIDGDKTTLDVSWTRADSVNSAAPPHVADRRVMTLRLGQRHVLDFLSVENLDEKTANVVLEVETPLDDSMSIESALSRARAESSEPSKPTLAYDLWLVHETADGRKITRRIDISGQDSLMARFRFEPLAFSVEAAGAADDPNGPVKVGVEGGVMGRVRDDGSLEMTLLSMRIISCARGLTAHESGVKQFSTLPGETTAVDLPWAFGYCALGPDVSKPVSQTPGVVIDDRQRRVEFKEFFAGQRTSILVRARVKEP